VERDILSVVQLTFSPDRCASYSGIRALPQLLELLKARGVSAVHRADYAPSAQAAHRDATICSIANAERARVGRVESDLGWFTGGICSVPESLARGRQKVDDFELFFGSVCSCGWGSRGSKGVGGSRGEGRGGVTEKALVICGSSSTTQ